MAGFPREVDDSARVGRDWVERTLLGLARVTLNAARGTMFQYSNFGYQALGLALSRAAGIPFEAAVEREVLRPLGMSHTFFDAPDSLAGRIIAGVVRTRTGLDTMTTIEERRKLRYSAPSGGLFATLSDVARFGAALARKGPTHLLSDASRAELFRWQNALDAPYAYGLGFILSGSTVGHDGGVNGYSAYYCVDTVTGAVAVILRSSGVGRTDLGVWARSAVASVAR
jgi:CubicO group peptidase (beta-lactamase class C family)